MSNNDRTLLDFGIDDLRVVYKNGVVERLNQSPIVPPTPQDPITGVSSKDIKISPNFSARLFLPNLNNPNENQKLPIIVYYHGGGFCVGSAFSVCYHNYMNNLCLEANAIGVSVEYRLAPEHPLPAGYEDAWTALQWVTAHAIREDDTRSEIDNLTNDPWLIKHGDFDKVFIAGDSAGGNIVHNLAIRGTIERLQGDVKIAGALLFQPFFWGSKDSDEKHLLYKIWEMAYPLAPNGVDNPMVNPFVENAPSLSRLAFPRLFVCTAEKDFLREKGLQYVEALKKSGYKGEVELVDVEDAVHCFQIFQPHSEKSKHFMKRVVSFLMK